MMTIVDPRERVPGLLFWQVCVLAGVFGVVAGEYPAPGIAGAMALGAAAALPSGRRFCRTMLLLACFLGALFSSLYARPHPPETPPWVDPAERLRITGDIVSVTGLPDRRLRILLENVHPEGSSLPAIPGLVSWTWDQGQSPGSPRPLPGQRVHLTTKIRPAKGFANQSLDGTAAYWAERNIWHTAWAINDQGDIVLEGQGKYFAALREHWREAMVHALGGCPPATDTFRSGQHGTAPSRLQAKAMLPALLFGDRYGLDSTTISWFTKAGLVHSLALSGQHLALAGSVAAVLIWLLGRGRAAIFLRLPRRTLVLVGALPFAALYLWLGDGPPSLVRASIMMLSGALLWLGKRSFTLLDVLFFAVLCFLIFQPRAVFDLSVQLSVLSVAGIALGLPFLRRLRRYLDRRLAGNPLRVPVIWAAMLMGTSLAVQMTTLPILIHTFGRVSVMFALNLIWLPPLGILVLPLAALGLALLLLTGSATVAGFVFMLADLPATAMLALLEYLDGAAALPEITGLKATAWSMLGYAAAIIALSMTAGRKHTPPATLVPLLLALVLLPSGALQREAQTLLATRENRVELRVLDVGQGQAVVLEYPGGRMLIDGAGMLSPRLEPGRDIVAQALTVNRPPRLSAIMASHGDLDHTRGLISILKLFRVDEVMYSALPLKSNTGDHITLEKERIARNIPLRTLQTGDIINLGNGLSLEIVHPPAEGRFSSNNGSLIVRLTRHGQGLALLCGDAESAALKRILRNNTTIQAEVLIVPHHGSASSLVPEFYDAVSPTLALISCGAYNSFGFPKKEVTDALGERGIAIRTTAADGEIQIVWTDRKPMAVLTCRPPSTKE